MSGHFCTETSSFQACLFSVTTLAPSTTHFILDIGAQYGWRRSTTPRTRKFVGFRSFFCMCVMFTCVYRHKSFRLTHWYVSMLGDSTSVACRAVRGDGNRRLNWLSNLACSDYPDCLTLLVASMEVQPLLETVTFCDCRLMLRFWWDGSDGSVGWFIYIQLCAHVC